jgi:sRNA-binding regulator protein Hfq
MNLTGVVKTGNRQDPNTFQVVKEPTVSVSFSEGLLLQAVVTSLDYFSIISVHINI